MPGARTEVWARKTRAACRRSLVAPLRFSSFLPEFILGVGRFTHATCFVYTDRMLRLSPRRNVRYVDESGRVASILPARVGKSLVVAYIIHTISGRVCRLGPELTSCLHTRHQIEKNPQRETPCSRVRWMSTRAGHNGKERYTLL